jgi:uncharacterized protein (DUF433 family)
MANMNPRIATAQIGIRELRQITIYPLSAGQQTQIVEIVTILVNSIAEQRFEGLSELQLVEFFSTAIRDNIEKVLQFVTDPEAKVSIDEIDNVQLADIIEIIFNVNFGEALKKFKAIWEEAKKVFLTPKSSQNFVEKPLIK